MTHTKKIAAALLAAVIIVSSPASPASAWYRRPYYHQYDPGAAALGLFGAAMAGTIIASQGGGYYPYL